MANSFEQQIRRASERASERLFTSGNGDHGERLALQINGEVNRRSTGWCEKAVADQIEKVLLVEFGVDG